MIVTDVDTVRASYDAVAERYAVEIGDELIDKPVDRAMYALFAELVAGLVRAGGEVADVGFAVMARTDREPWPAAEHLSRRSYLLAQHA